MKEYRTIHEVSGPLMVVDHVEGVPYDELAEIQLHSGEVRRCKVLEVNGDRAVVQLFDSSAGINLRDATIRFLGHPLQLGVSADMLGRVFNGMGEPIDGGPALLADVGTNGEMALLSDGTIYCCATAAGPAFEGVGISCGSAAVSSPPSSTPSVDSTVSLASSPVTSAVAARQSPKPSG